MIKKICISWVMMMALTVAAKAQYKTPDSIAKTFILALQKQDEKLFVSMFPGKDTMRAMLYKLITNEEQRKLVEEMLNDKGELFEGKGYKEQFDKDIRRLKREITVPSKMELIDYKVSLDKKERDGDAPKVNMYKVDYTVKYNNTEYILEADEIIEFNGNYYGIELNTIQRANETGAVEVDISPVVTPAQKPTTKPKTTSTKATKTKKTVKSRKG